MKVILTYATALRYWRTHPLSSTAPSKSESLSDVATSMRAITPLLPRELLEEGGDIQVLGDRSLSKSASATHKTLAWSGALPPGSLRKISGEVYLSSPEMCFMQFCARNSLARCVLLGAELCGSYSIGSDGRGRLYGRPQLTTPGRIDAYLKGCEGRTGVKRARVALKYIFPNSASPMESVVAMLLCMPLRYGGYGLPWPEMNHGISLGDGISSIAGKQSYRCDLYWPDKKVALEYNSIEFHAEADAMNRDYKRANVLTSMGSTVVSVTWQMIKHEQAFDDLARLLAKMLDVRVRPETRQDKFKQARSKLRREIMAPIIL